MVESGTQERKIREIVRSRSQWRMCNVKQNAVSVMVAFLAVVAQTLADGATPSWWNGCAYDTDRAWFVGRGLAETTENVRKDELEGKARTEALADAARNVCCRIVAESASRSRETGEGRKAQLEEMFESRSQVRALLRHVPRAQVLLKETKPDRVYVLAGFPRGDLAEVYRQDVGAITRRVEAAVDTAAKQVKEAPLEALKGYGDALTLHDELDECRWMLTFLDAGANVMPAAPTGRASRSAIEAAMRQLGGEMPQLLQSQLVSGLVAETVSRVGTNAAFYVYPLTYGRTDIVSPFGDRLTELLAVELGARNGWMRQRDPAKAGLWFCGRVAECGGGAQVVLQRMGSDGAIVAATQRFLTGEVLARLQFGEVCPTNMERLARDALALRQGQKANSDLRIEMRIAGAATDVPVVLREDDRPRLELRCNRDCRARIVHLFADGTRAVILNDFAMGVETANQWVGIPVKIRITPPFGVEQVLVQAVADGDLPPIKTRTERTGTGRVTVVDGDLGSELVRVRGSVKEAVLSEAIYTWTILPKAGGAEKMPDR
jgi:hypothetical protein